MNAERPWTAYRTRFLVHARQLTEALIFTDALGREHSGQCGDYLVESSDGLRRITPRLLFEDIYVPLHSPAKVSRLVPVSTSGQDIGIRRQPTSVQRVSVPTWNRASSTSAKGGLAGS